MCEPDIAPDDPAAYLEVVRRVTGMRLHLLTSFGFSALALGFFVGCAGGQTGDLSGQNDQGGGPSVGETFGGCEENKEELEGFDTETAAGTPEALLGYAEGTFEAPISWKTAAEGQAWSLAPESDKGQLHLTVTRGTKAYLLTYTQPKDQGPGGIELASGGICPEPRLGVESHVDVSTEGGALAESFDTLLRSTDVGVATLTVPLDLAKLGGSLSASSANPKSKLVQTQLEATLTAAGTTGRITAMEQTDGGQVASASRALLAVWPDSAACADAEDGVGLEVSLADTLLGTNGTETLASIALEAPADITWMDDSTTKLAVGIESTGNGCFRVKDEWPIAVDSGPGMSYPVRVTLKSDDGRVDGQYDGHAVVSGSGSDRRIQVEAVLEVDTAHAADSGFSGVSVPTSSERILVSFKVSRQQGTTSGSVDLFAVTSSPCVSQPPMSTPGGGASAPGCDGDSVTRLENAAWSY